MLLARYRAFLQEVAGDTSIQKLVRSISIYRSTQDAWFDEQNVEVVDAVLRHDLSRSPGLWTHWRPRKSPKAFFPVSDLACVVVATFYFSPRKTTRDQLAALLARDLEHSAHAFGARHDNLTGLYNREAFDPQVRAALNAQFTTSVASSSTAETLSAPFSVSLLAIDLDNFKQVNDTYGHLYGDVVLRCFAHRAERALASIEGRLVGRAKLALARVGGEEFLLLIAGALSSAEVDDIAEGLRQIVASSPLPDDTEWGVLSSVESASLRLPHVAERRITVSIGISSTAALRELKDEGQAIAQLRAQADTALFRAKAGGRNVVRRFADILARYGAVLEHHAETNVVAIDIGRQVNVGIGQEFVVYHPDFSGAKPFIYSDGRTRKRLGEYPRDPSGRIVAFDVQQEISFCRVVAKKLDGLFPPGSALEVVPLGAIAHLLTSQLALDKLGALSLTPVERLPQVIKQLTDTDRQFCVVVFALRNVDALAEARGTFFVNQALKNLYEAVHERFPPRPILSQVHPAQFAAVLENVERLEATTLTQAALQLAESSCEGLATFRAGAFGRSEQATSRTGDKSELSPANALDYARYAVSTPEDKAEPVEWFSAVTAQQIVWNWRSRQMYRDAIADYLKFRDLGVRYSHLENHAALSAISIRPVEKEMALEAAKRARELEPEAAVFRANHAYIECYWGDRIKAHAIFQEVPKTFKFGEVYEPAIALASHAQYQVDRTKVDVQYVRLHLEKALRLDRNIVSADLRTEMEAALASLAQTSATTSGLDGLASLGEPPG